MLEAPAQEDEGGALVKAQLSSHSATVSTVDDDVKSEPVVAAEEANCALIVKQLKLRLFQQLTRHHGRHAWPQYWRALQQYLVARLSQDELQCIVTILLGPDLGM